MKLEIIRYLVDKIRNFIDIYYIALEFFIKYTLRKN